MYKYVYINKPMYSKIAGKCNDKANDLQKC